MNLSNSYEQQTAESYILDILNKDEELNLKSKRLALSNGASVQLDGFDEEKGVICEIYARIGKLKGSQPDKVASDFLKMLLVEKDRKRSLKKVFCFASLEASSYLSGKAWLAYAARDYDIEIKTVKIPEEVEEFIKRAQKRQKMINAPV